MNSHNTEEPSKYNMYLAANNLYGWDMSQYLPTGGFKWLCESEINTTNYGKYIEERKKGLVLEVDLDYPQELHESHNDYPLAAEKICVSPSMLCNYCERVTEIQYKEH